jgi:WD40 repeat protein
LSALVLQGCGKAEPPQAVPVPPAAPVTPGAPAVPNDKDLGVTELRCPELRDSFATQVRFSPDGRLLAVVRSHFGMILWDLETRRVRAEFLEEPKATDASIGSVVSFSPDSRMLFWSENYSARLFDIPGRQDWKLDLGSELRGTAAAAFSPDGAALFAVGQDASGFNRAFLVWELKSRKLRVMPFPEGRIRGAGFSAQADCLATIHYPEKPSGSKPYRIAMWEPATGKKIGELLGVPEFTARRAVFSPDGGILATGYLPWNAAKTPLSLWDVKKRKLICSLSVKKHDNFHMCFGAAGRTLYCSDGAALRAWRLNDPTRPIAVTLPAGVESVYGFDVSPDGQTLATTAYEAVKLWPIGGEGAAPGR